MGISKSLVMLKFIASPGPWV